MGRKRLQVSSPFVDLGRTGKKYMVKCNLCKIQFESFRMSTHHCKNMNNAELYKNLSESKCNLCGHTFSTISNAQKHLRDRKCAKLNASFDDEAEDQTTIEHQSPQHVIEHQSPQHAIEYGNNTPSPPSTFRVFIVVDTNAFISDLETIDELLTTGKHIHNKI